MIIILSPSKTLNENPLSNIDTTSPIFEDQSAKISQKLKTLTKPKIKALMGISDKLTALNHQRFQSFNPHFEEAIGTPAIHTFMGDVFVGLQSEDFSEQDLQFAENRLFILSGLYGLLKPSTRIQPYRLEMGSKLKIGRKDNLYAFWDSSLTDTINQIIPQQKEEVLINLASQEYSKAIQLNNIKGKVITVQFREWRNEKWQFVSFNAKKARGLMARYIVKNRIETSSEIMGFDWEDYHYNSDLSNETEWFFTK